MKSATYKNILDNFDHLEPQVLKDISSYSKDDYKKTLKASIRVTYFHAIETLFEIIFALERGIRHLPEEDQDQLILHRLSKSDYAKNFERIRLIGEGVEAETNKLREKIFFKSVNREISLIQYIFYYFLDGKNSDITDEYWAQLEGSLQAIIKTLSILARDFSDRKEYNAYKHGLRIIPLATGFRAFESNESKASLDLDFSDSMTFITEDGNELRLVTKAFDTERDFKMTAIASEFMENIISIRKGVYFETKPYVRFFQQDKLDKITRLNIRARELVVTLKFDKPLSTIIN